MENEPAWPNSPSALAGGREAATERTKTSKPQAERFMANKRRQGRSQKGVAQRGTAATSKRNKQQ
jgi:hypothetical protein